MINFELDIRDAIELQHALSTHLNKLKGQREQLIGTREQLTLQGQTFQAGLTLANITQCTSDIEHIEALAARLKALRRAKRETQ